MKATPHFRPNTMDEAIYWMSVVKDEYEILGDNKYGKNDIFIDIGAHAGYVSLAMLERGVGFVLAFEVNPENFMLAQNTLTYHMERVGLYHRAVWSESNIFFGITEETFEGDNANTGAPALAISETVFGTKALSVAFDSIIQNTGFYIATPKRVIVKIDAEHSEWQCLLTSKRLRQIDVLVGEYHEVYDKESIFAVPGQPCTWFHLEKVLRAEGFDNIICKPWRDTNMGIFQARRSTPAHKQRT